MQTKPSLPKYTFGILGGILLFLGGLVPVFLFGILSFILNEINHYNFLENDTVMILSNMTMWLGAIAAFDFLVCRPQTGKKLNFNLSTKNVGTYLIIFPMMFGMMLIAEFFTTLIPVTGPVFGDLYRLFSKLMENLSQDTFFMIFMAVIMAPIFEEIVFRGIIQKGLINNGTKPMVAIWISAVIFGIVHGNPWQFVGAVLLGYVLGIVYHKTQSLLLPIILHAFNNLVSTLLIKYAGIESFAEAFSIPQYVILVIGIVIFGVFNYIFMHKYKVHHSEN